MEFALIFLLWVAIVFVIFWGSLLMIGVISLIHAKTQYLNAQRKMIE